MYALLIRATVNIPVWYTQKNMAQITTKITTLYQMYSYKYAEACHVNCIMGKLCSSDNMIA